MFRQGIEGFAHRPLFGYYPTLVSPPIIASGVEVNLRRNHNILPSSLSLYGLSSELLFCSPSHFYRSLISYLSGLYGLLHETLSPAGMRESLPHLFPVICPDENEEFLSCLLWNALNAHASSFFFSFHLLS